MGDPIFRQKIVASAQHYAGRVQEVGYNHGATVEHFQRAAGLDPDPNAPGPAWCACFVTCCGLEAIDPALSNVQAARQTLKASHFLPSASCEAIREDAASRGTLQAPTVTPEPGWLVLYHFAGEHAGANHIGIVIADGGDQVHTVEGNTSAGAAGSQREGDGVFARTRAKSNVINWVAT